MTLHSQKNSKDRDAQGRRYLNLDSPTVEIRLVNGIDDQVTRIFRIHECLLSRSLQRKQDEDSSTSHIEIYDGLEPDVRIYLRWLYVRKLPVLKTAPWSQLLGGWSLMAILFDDHEFGGLLYKKACDRAMQLEGQSATQSAWEELEKLHVRTFATCRSLVVTKFMVDFYIIHRGSLNSVVRGDSIYRAVIDRLLELRNGAEPVVDFTPYDTIQTQKPDPESSFKLCDTTEQLIELLGKDLEKISLTKQTAL